MLKPEDYDNCPHCHGSFSFNRPKADGICPWCKQVVGLVSPVASKAINQQPEIEMPAKYVEPEDDKSPLFNIHHLRELLRDVCITTTQTDDLKYQILFNDIPVGGKIEDYNTARDIQLWLYRVKNIG